MAPFLLLVGYTSMIAQILISHFILLFFVSDIVVSQSIVKSLPGFAGDLPFKLETGYIGIGEKDDIQLFYYFVESERSPEDDPLMIWLAGGPGCSTLRGFFYEIGPLSFNYANSSGNKPTLELNPYSWTKVANIIFLDQPVGTGFSYAKNWDGYITSDSLSAVQTYDFLRKWLMVHPKFLSNPLYVSGISYTGIIVPIVVQEIYNGNEVGNEPPMNIKGYILGNPLTDKNNDVNSRLEFAHRVCLLSDGLYKSTKANCNGNYTEVDGSNTLCMSDLQAVNLCVEKINFQQILEPLCTGTSKPNLLKWERSALEEDLNLLRLPPQLPQPWCRDYDYLYCSIWANDRTVQEALHIRQGTVKEFLNCNKSMSYSFGRNDSISYSFNVPSSIDYHRHLVNESCRALIFSGDHDMAVPHVGTEEWINSLDLTVESSWAPWFVQGQAAGYTVSLSHNDFYLTYATVKGAGHTGPEYKPQQCLAMVDRWFAYYPL